MHHKNTYFFSSFIMNLISLHTKIYISFERYQCKIVNLCGTMT